MADCVKVDTHNLQFTDSHSNSFSICGTCTVFLLPDAAAILADRFSRATNRGRLLFEDGDYMYFVGYTRLCAACTTCSYLRAAFI